MEMVDAGDFGEVGGGCAISGGGEVWLVVYESENICEGKGTKNEWQALDENVLHHVLAACISKHLRCARGFSVSAGFEHHFSTRACGVLPVLPKSLETAGKH